MKSRLFIALILVQCAALILLITDSALTFKARKPELLVKQQLVEHLMITDLALWSEARYTRHPSQADIFSPFQDFPGAPEHFPSGSIIAPPRMLFTGQME